MTIGKITPTPTILVAIVLHMLKIGATQTYADPLLGGAHVITYLATENGHSGRWCAAAHVAADFIPGKRPSQSTTARFVSLL